MFFKALDVKMKRKMMQLRRSIVVATSIIESMIYQIKERGMRLSCMIHPCFSHS
ncbi:hypothetical protein RchiOBHm_Chr5g0053311 [Rosa chinensis]|uniref:Uncharacterized protein n=1 Tax=Rosa chinensis TaxID=74649 RepID=A0A2P6QFW1_ROSCH|nr:hypothetical protein RchiOBHm_Chr5g0053311 [Rosa chinensis]